MHNRLTIGQAACSRAGVNQISSFDEAGSKEARTLRTNYDIVVGNELDWPWRFIMGQVACSVVGEVIDPWMAVVNKPSGCLYIKKVMVSGRDVDWGVYMESKIGISCALGENDVVTVDGAFQLQEPYWRDYFRELVVLRLAALLASGVLRDAELFTALSQRGDLQQRRARQMDSSQQTTNVIDSSMVRASRGGR